MVNLIWLLLLPFILIADVSISTVLDQEVYYENQPISGEIQMTIPQTSKVDENSFLIGEKPLKVNLSRQIPFKGPDGVIILTYRFKLDAEKKGLKMLSPISVKVDGKRYSSPGVSYEVKGINIKAKPGSLLLKIENVIDAPKELYPGQKITLGYRYLYQGAIDLDQEILPMVDQVPFKRLGEKIIEDSSEGNTSIRTIKQFMQIEKEGTFSFPSAKVRGYAYQTAPNGSKIYIQPALESATDPITFKVKPFPEKDKPPFFNGAIGPFTLQAQAELPPVLMVNDRFNLKLNFEGAGVINTLKPPVLGCIPGFVGNFELSDLPPEGSEKEGQKSFNYELKPLNPWTLEIPSVIFAYFDPESASYKIIKSDPIAIKIQGSLKDKKTIQTEPVNPEAKLAEAKNLGEAPFFLRAPIIISSPWMLILLPLIALYVNRKKKKKPVTREDLINEALKSQNLDEFSLLANQLLSKDNPLLVKIDSVRYGQDKTSLKDLKNDFGKLFMGLLCLFAPMQASFYQSEEDLNQKLSESLKQEEWTESALYLNALNHPIEALYYYEKAYDLNPWSSAIWEKLNETRKELSLETESRHWSLPLPWIISLFSLILILAILFKSRAFYTLSLILFVFIFVLHFTIPLKGLMLQADTIRMAPYADAPPIGQIPPGTLVEVLDQAEEGKYLKIKDKQGKIGFISFEKIRII